MTAITMTPLPNAVGPQNFSNVELQRLAMLLMENIKSLKRQLESAQQAVVELQRGKSLSLDIDPVAVHADAVAAANAAQAASTSASSAQGASGQAGIAAAAAAGSATDAAGSAETASAAAARAEAAASGISGVLANFAIRNVDIGANVPRSTFNLSSFGAEATRYYKVKVTFTNEGTVARTCTLTAGGETKTVSLGNTAGSSGSAEATLKGDGVFVVDNIATSVAVEISIVLSEGGE